jgi:hypothetical protein
MGSYMNIPYAAGICNIRNSVTVEHSKDFLILNKSCNVLDFSCLSQAFYVCRTEFGHPVSHRTHLSSCQYMSILFANSGCLLT